MFPEKCVLLQELQINRHMTIQRHAFIILAHHRLDVLYDVLSRIDDPANDIYVHIDVKCKDFDVERLRNICVHSEVCVIPERLDVKWGDISQVEAEITGFKWALKGRACDYYHLISGEDYPLVSQSRFHDFFRGKNTSYIEYDYDLTFEQYHRYSLYALPEKLRKPFIQKVWNKMQIIAGVDRLKKMKKAKKKPAYGSNWCSLTYEAVNFLISSQAEIRRIVAHTTCPDEFYKQTILLNGGLPIVNDNLRYIDWSACLPNPKTLGLEDFDKLKNSGKFFARKITDDRLRKRIFDELISKIR